MTQKFETGKLISVCIIAYFAVAVYALQLDAAWKFWMMATFVGVFQGAIQALSRSYYAKIIPKENRLSISESSIYSEKVHLL